VLVVQEVTMKIELNAILHQPIRTRIMAYLVAQGAADYTQLKKEFDLSDGHMTTHMRELLAHDYVIAQKAFVRNKPKTTYHITEQGKLAFAEYVKKLRDIVLG